MYGRLWFYDAGPDAAVSCDNALRSANTPADLCLTPQSAEPIYANEEVQLFE